MGALNKIGKGAGFLLGSIRVVNGAIGLFYPQLIQRQLRGDLDPDPATHYALRLFGSRTILIGLDLLTAKGDVKTNAIEVAPIIHASDTIAALIAAKSGIIPERAAKTIVIISATNTVLALIMQLSNDSSSD